MRTAITIGYRHGSEKAELLFGPPLTPVDQRQAFKDEFNSSEHADYRRVELWESGAGMVKWRRMNKPQVKAASVTPSTLIDNPQPIVAPPPSVGAKKK